MGILSKLFSLFFKDEDDKLNENISTNQNDEYEDNSHYQYDKNDDDYDDGEGLTDAEAELFQHALERFYFSLSEREQEDEDLNEAIEKIQEDYFAHKIKDPGKALKTAYQQWKSSKPQRALQKRNNRTVIIDMLRRFDDLTIEERQSLTDPGSRYWVNHLKRQDSEAISQIIKYWFDNKLLDDDKYEVINDIMESGAECSTMEADKYYDCLEEVPLTKEDYLQRIVIFKNDYQTLDYAYDNYALYFQRYWLESGDCPEPIKCHDLIANRPCYLKTELLLVSPHFHMGRRYFERDSFQEATIYLFADSLEIISDGGHTVLTLSDIIEAKINNWDSQREPNMLEITCRNKNKALFHYRNSQEKVDLIILRALIYYFIKKQTN